MRSTRHCAQILQLEALQARLVTFTAIAFGAVVSVGFQAESALIVLAYPVLALVLGVNWMCYAHNIQRSGNYIRSLERRLRSPHLGWELYVLTERQPVALAGEIGHPSSPLTHRMMIR